MSSAVKTLGEILTLGPIGAAAFSAVSSIFTPPKAPDAPIILPPAAPAPAADTTTAAAYAQAEAMRKRQGAASTILTGPMGVTNTPGTTKTQLGA